MFDLQVGALSGCLRLGVSLSPGEQHREQLIPNSVMTEKVWKFLIVNFFFLSFIY